jgi:hypothetical protein
MKHRRRLQVVASLIVVTLVELSTSQAKAWDIGWGFGAFNYVPRPGDFLNQHDLLRGANATGGPVSNNVYANNPNSYLNRIRDNGLVSHYDIETRSSPPFQTARPRPSSVTRTSSDRPRTAPAPAPVAPTVPRPVVPIGSFFNAARKLVWPSDAPVAGDLLAKRNTSDQACLEVSDLVDKHGSAPITTVTIARQKLLDYGQPALAFMRENTTSRVAETFHLFLLSLYEALAQAANPLVDAAASNAAP